MEHILLIDKFINYLDSTEKSPSTLVNYRHDLNSFSKWFNESNKFSFDANLITVTDLREYKHYLIDYPFKPKTINRRLGSLRSFIQWLWDTNTLKDKFPLPKLVKEDQPKPKWLDKNQQHALMRHLDRYGNKRDTHIIAIFLNTGMRVQEFVNLRWSDITISDKKGNIMIRYSKANRYREVPLNKDARYAFIELGFKEHAGKNEYVLQGQRGHITTRGIQMMVKRRVEYTELEFITPHILRHTFCKNLVNAGVGLEQIAILAGHETLETTKLYCHPSKDDLAESVELIGELD
ncbi:tyrosine-type recombinase/integrase [Francisella sp. SYW-9]|uniref:tyrosine-type recombinase/integrase n=1 Tax=Francisella sp. SYW-9 TaxID=2610888 RepID=UPI00123C7BDB|nr:tyrosine-type recombinase/integrase [Francisella sp. SYW-9]